LIYGYLFFVKSIKEAAGGIKPPSEVRDLSELVALLPKGKDEDGD